MNSAENGKNVGLEIKTLALYTVIDSVNGCIHVSITRQHCNVIFLFCLCMNEGKKDWSVRKKESAFLSPMVLSSWSITQHRATETVFSLGSKWNSARDQKQNLILSPRRSASLQHISSLVMWEPSRNSSLDRQLLDLSIGEPAGEWEFGVNAFALYSTLKVKFHTELNTQ